MPLFVTILMLLPSTTWAARTKIDVKAELLLNGKIVARPRIITLAGQEAQVVQKSGPNELMRMKVLARPTTEKMDELKLDFDLEYRSGDRVVYAQPQVFAKAGSEAVMTLEETLEGEKIQFKILASPHKN